MTREEIMTWIWSARFISTEIGEHDDCGNYDATLIYEKDGKLFRVQMSNGIPNEKWGDKGWIRGEYSPPQEVTRKTRMVEEIYYEPELRR